MRIRLAILTSIILSTDAFAQEPVGCDKFKWPIERERALLTTAMSGAAANNELSDIPATATRLELVPYTNAKLPEAPERVPKDPASFASFVRIAKVAKPGLYAISLSANAWIDAIQDGKHLKTVAFSGATGCDNIRKVVRFELGAAPLLIQLTAAPSDSIAIAILPASD